MSDTMIIATSGALAVDTLAASIAIGTCGKPSWHQTILTTVVFTTCSTGLLLGGWTLATTTALETPQPVTAIASILIILLGLRSVVKNEGLLGQAAIGKRVGISSLIATGLLTSVDAAAVGFASPNYPFGILKLVISLSITTVISVRIGFSCGSRISAWLNDDAEAVGGLVLVSLGTLGLVH